MLVKKKSKGFADSNDAKTNSPLRVASVRRRTEDPIKICSRKPLLLVRLIGITAIANIARSARLMLRAVVLRGCDASRAGNWTPKTRAVGSHNANQKTNEEREKDTKGYRPGSRQQQIQGANRLSFYCYPFC